MDVYENINTRNTPQSEQADPRQRENNAGGFTFTIEPLDQVQRFLMLGTDSGTYYTRPQDLTRENAKVVMAVAETQHREMVDLIVRVSTEGRAPRQNATIFAYAIACSMGTDDEKRHALNQMNRVLRTGTHLFLFAKYIEQFRGWGRGLRRAVANWYLDKPIPQLGYQAVKYRQREGWTHRDLLRLSHPESTEAERKALFEWIVRGTQNVPLPRVVLGHLAAMADPSSAFSMVREYRLPWEALPTEALAQRDVWAELVDQGMPQTALMRNLPRLTNLGVLEGERLRAVVEQLQDRAALQNARVHPINVLIAQKTYAQGHGERGSMTWTPKRQIVDALDAAFYNAFAAVEPTGKRILLALDVSGSMGWGSVPGVNLTAREVSAAMSLVTAATETDYEIVGFTGMSRNRYNMGRQRDYNADEALTPLTISPRQRLDDVIRTVSDLPFGTTDCALPMVWARQHQREFDAFVIYTDSETWAGAVHPHQALREYREQMGINAKSIVVAATSTGFSIADPADPGSLDVVGFDSAVPNLIADFIR